MMKNCEQTKGQSVLEHGISVKNYLFDLINHLRNGDELKYNWILPDWIYSYKDLIMSSLPDDTTLELYTKYHDCGKPFCLTIDDDGKRHFSNHAEVSYQIFKQIFNNDVAAQLILHDMDIHLLKSDGVDEFCKNPFAITLLLTGLSEVHSNSQMFGGTDSVSFKIKWKSINQRGKQILNKLKNNK
jgi:uncharacterized protein YlaN (UPF0358 family)